MWRAWLLGLGVACLALSVLALSGPAFAETPASLLARAVTCQLQDNELAGFPSALAKADPAFAAPTRHAAPSYDRYAAGERVTAFGYVSKDVVLMPDRVAMLVPATERKKIGRALRLKGGASVPSSREVGPNRSIVAYELHGEGMAGKLVLGCEYTGDGAAGWGADGGP